VGVPDIRPLASIAEIQAAVDLQKEVWQAEDRDLVPATEIVAARANGGIVLGAWSGGRLVGFTFSMVGRRAGRVYQYSRMLAVHPEWRGHGLGAALKLAQKAASLAAGDTRMEWTFDPLEGRNANLNIARLGARVCHYERDFYGARTSRFDLGIPTDRVRAEWDLTEDLEVTGPLRRLSGGAVFAMTVGVEDPAEGPGNFQLPKPPIDYWIPVPVPFQPIRESNADAALAWRMSQRRAFEAAFERGYVVVDFRHTGRGGAGLGHYVLRHPDAEPAR
jgi:predicted GNAT superfamily acetyltransferase